MPSGNEWMIIVLIALVVFGGSQLPKIARNLGTAQKEFKKGLAESKAEEAKEKQTVDKSTDEA
ncbi:MAG: twin-arginine translocase TatA/TatE family subunit [Microthrixaceae bacterium]